MIFSITVTNHLGESLTIDLRSPEQSGLLVREITGLGPPKANVNSYDLATIDGSRFVSSRVQTRNIVVMLSPIWTETSTVEDNRLKAYRYFPIKQQIQFAVKTENRDAYVIGYVESNEANIFSNDEILTISILCPDPYFYEFGDGHVVSFSDIDPTFEFEFSNESLSTNLIELSTIQPLHSRTITYEGDAEIGMVISLRFFGPISGDIYIYNGDTNEGMTLDVDAVSTGIMYNDYINISTIKGQKYVQHVRGSTITNVINAIDHNSDWLILRKGANLLIYDVEDDDYEVEMSVIFRPAYQGV